MPRPRTLSRAVEIVERSGALLVYPLANRPDPPSLWSALHPRTPMRWAWDSGADPRVADLWQLREELARSRAVVYTKWWSGRATFFAREVFRAMLARLRAGGDLEARLEREARDLLDALRDDSPRGTKALRAATDLAGRANEGAFARGMRALWERLLVVGAGESEEGGFPSLLVGATDLLFEDLWTRAEAPRAGDDALLAKALASPAFARALRRVERGLVGA